MGRILLQGRYFLVLGMGILCFWLGLSAACLAQECAPDEELTGTIMVWGIPVGDGKVQIWRNVKWEGHQVGRVVATGETTGIIALFYRVKDSMESLFDPGSYLPYLFRVHFEEGTYRRIQEYRFDQAAKIIRGPQGSELKMEQPTYDPISAILYLRVAPLMEGHSLSGSVSDGRKMYRMQVDVKVETKDIGDKKVSCWVLDPKMELVDLGGILSKQKFRRVYAWFTKDEARVPVLVKGDLFFGALTAKLDERRVQNPQDEKAALR